MSPNAKLLTGRVILTVIAVGTIVSPYIADWNATHIYNPLWPPHAKFHNAQTMVMGVMLGISGLFFLWRRRGDGADLVPAIVLIALYWVSQLPAFLFPGVAWTDPNLLQPGQSLTDVPIQLKGDVVLFPLMILASWLVLRGRTERAAASE
jgi:hypothetical protein